MSSKYVQRIYDTVVNADMYQYINETYVLSTAFSSFLTANLLLIVHELNEYHFQSFFNVRNSNTCDLSLSYV